MFLQKDVTQKISKYKKDKTKMLREIKKMKQLKTQFDHETRKKEKIITRLKKQIRLKTYDKEKKTHYLNSFGCIDKMPQY